MVIGTIANIALGFLFVATMHQIQYSIKMMNDPLIDGEKAGKHKVYVYLVAFVSTVIFAALLIISESEIITLFGHRATPAIMLTAYSVLPIVYLITLYQLKTAMKTLLQEMIDTERNTVLN